MVHVLSVLLRHLMLKNIHKYKKPVCKYIK